MPLQRYYAEPYRVVAPHPHQPQLPPLPLANHHPPYHQISPAPHYLDGKDIRLQARDAGVQNAFVCNEYYPGRSTYQPIPAPIAYPGQIISRPAPTPTSYRQHGVKSAVPDALIPGKRKALDNKLQREPLPQPAVDVVLQEVRVGTEMSSERIPPTKLYELDADSNQVPRVETKDFDPPTKTSPPKSSRPPSKRSSIVQEFSHMAHMIVSELPHTSFEPIAHEIEDYSYLSCLITPGSLPAAPSAPSSSTPPSLTSSPTLSAPDTSAPLSPAIPPLALVTLPLITVTSPSTPPLLSPKPRAYQPLIDYEACNEDAYRDSRTYYSRS